MEDAELVLRFFALRNIEHFQLEIADFLDLYMMKSLNFSRHDIQFFGRYFSRNYFISLSSLRTAFI
jgi:hypothetical protein